MGWQYYWTATPLSYLEPLIHGIRLAAQHYGCNLLLGCGLGVSATTSDPLRSAWPIPTPGADFVPIGAWNTDGLIAVTPLHLPALSRDIQAMIADGHPVQFVGSGERGPTIAADAQSRLMTIPGVDDARVELVWEPPWNQEMISLEGRMKLGMV